MKKGKFVLICALTVLMALCVFTLCSCDRSGNNADDNTGNGGDIGEHTHVYSQSVVAPTCTQDGYTLYTCACGESYTDNQTAATGHAESVESKENEVKADCLTAGSYTSVLRCKACNEITGSEHVAVAKGEHAYEIGVCSVCGEAEDCNTDELLFELSSDGESYVVSGFKETITKVHVPYFYQGKPVTAIGANAFTNCDAVTSIILPNSITDIGRYAFYDCRRLKTIHVSSGLKRIDKDTAFAKIDCLETVYFNGTVADFCAIEELHTLMNVNKNKKLYIGGEEVVDLVIPEGVTNVPMSAFYGVSSITSVTMPKSVRTMDDDVFRFCSSLKTVYWNAVSCEEGWYHSLDGGWMALCMPFADCPNFTDLIIGDEVEYIGPYLFHGNTIPSVTIPDNVKRIGKEAFSDCKKLKSVTIGKGVEEIGPIAFMNCTALETVYWNAVECSGGWVENNTIYDIFHGCTKLTKAVVGDGVQGLPYHLFRKITSLKTVVIPDGMLWVDKEAFLGCTGLQYVFIKGDDPFINIAEGNEAFSAVMYFYSETDPDGEFDGWHYDEQGNIVPW